MDDLEKMDYEFDIQRLFDEAVETFRIEKYNKNHERVLSEIKQVFRAKS
jgi:hypothetical protein